MGQLWKRLKKLEKELDGIMAEVSHLETIYCDKVLKHNWVEEENPEDDGQLMRCTKCEAVRWTPSPETVKERFLLCGAG